MNNKTNDIGRRLKIARIGLGLSLADIGKVIGHSPTTVMGYESEKHQIRYVDAIMLIEWLTLHGISPDFLHGDSTNVWDDDVDPVDKMINASDSIKKLD